jgi:hypothetical protein
VTTGSWWAERLNPKGLSQGDLVAAVPIGTAWFPVTYLGRDKWQRGKDTYFPQRGSLETFKTDSTGLFIARGPVIRVLVVSHSCELDDKPDTGRVLVAPVASLDGVPEQPRRLILDQRRRAFMPLPQVPNCGDMYADLRCVAYLDRKLIPDRNRECSMNEDGLLRFQVQLIAYFTRLDPDPIEDALKAGISQHRE